MQSSGEAAYPTVCSPAVLLLLWTQSQPSQRVAAAVPRQRRSATAVARIVVFVLPERVTVGRLLLVTVVSTPGAVELPVLVLAWQTLRHSQRSGRQMASVALVRIPRPDRCVVGDRIPEPQKCLLVSYR